MVPFNKICKDNSKKTKVFNQQEIIAHTGILTMRNFLLISLQQFDYLFISKEMRLIFNKGMKGTLLVVFTTLISSKMCGNTEESDGRRTCELYVKREMEDTNSHSYGFK